MKTVYFVRHGQSEANIAPVFQGPDSPLSSEGREQARIIAGRIKNIPFDALLSSPFPRARDTALAIAETTGSQPEFSELFVERLKPTSINGVPFADERARDTWSAWDATLYDPDARVEDGENLSDMLLRADAALKLLEERPEKRLVVVTHGYFLRTLMARVLLGNELTPAGFRHLQRSAHMQNTGITVFRYTDTPRAHESKWSLWIYNDHAHLG